MTGYEPTPELIEAAAQAMYEADWGGVDDPEWGLGVSLADAYRADAAVAVAVVVPLIREQIAAEIENLPRLRDSYAYTYHDGTRDAARVARGAATDDH